MTREEAKELLPIIQAYAEGKSIEVFQVKVDTWREITDPNFDVGPEYYRVKPEPKYRPFKNKDECWQEMLKHQPFGWIIDSEENLIIISVSNAHIWFNDKVSLTFEDSFYNFKFTDGTPFGIKEE